MLQKTTKQGLNKSYMGSVRKASPIMDVSFVPIQCIVPPHMLKAIIESGSPAQRKKALQTLILAERTRGRREAIGRFAFTVPAGEKRRTVYDAMHCADMSCLPGRTVRGEGDSAVSDTSVNEAYDGAGATYDLYKEVYGRNSIDNRGMELISSVHFSTDWDNAEWNGQQMLYGDGDGEFFDRFTKAIDVIGHELTHGVIQYTANLTHQQQSGALNESISDVFGSLVKQYTLKQTADEADWLIGEGLLLPGVNGVALRSMKEPGTAYDDRTLGKDPQPGHMKDYQDLPLDEDNGGVHINSGIPNHAFCLIAMKVGGYAWEKAGRIWYVTLTRGLESLHNYENTDFQTMANVTWDVAQRLFGSGSPEHNAVKDGWDEVGITVKSLP